jgi:hypothetical protein
MLPVASRVPQVPSSTWCALSLTMLNDDSSYPGTTTVKPSTTKTHNRLCESAETIVIVVRSRSFEHPHDGL